MRPVVIDTNVLIAGLRSRHGASNKLLSLVGTDMFVTAVSVPLVLEIAVAAQCDAIITFNRTDFPDIHRFGIQVQTPGAFLKEINP